MSDLKGLAHFLYGDQFWYTNPTTRIDGLTEEQLLWLPHPKALCMLWQVGHIAHRERTHIGGFVQGIQADLIPPKYEVFGPDWCSAEDVRCSVDSVDGVLDWVRNVRRKTHEFIDSVEEDSLFSVPPRSEFDLTTSHWLFVTTVHTAMHLGRIELLRAMLEGEYDRPC
jgi:hypothetical protein